MNKQLTTIEAIKQLRHFIGHDQLAVMSQGLMGEESQHFADKFVEFAERINAMPKTYDQDGRGDGAAVTLHYFLSGCDWWIIEKDCGSDNDEPEERGKQLQAFGYACLGNPADAELGYISIAELIENGAELDLHFQPTTLAKVKRELQHRSHALATVSFSAN